MVQKVLAAHRQGLKTIILPKANEVDLEDVPDEVRKEMRFVLVEHLDEVLENALTPTSALVVDAVEEGRNGREHRIGESPR